jgi:hypothetical protein
MTKIYKYEVPLQETSIITGPIVKPLTVQNQYGTLQLWAEVNCGTNTLQRSLVITIVGTGREVPKDAGDYLCTVQQGVYVWHVYWKYAE